MWPVRTAVSLAWACLNRRDRAPVPAAATVKEAAARCAVLSAHYRPDPWDGRIDLTEDPTRTQFHLAGGSLAMLTGPDCDDLAAYAVAALRDLAGRPGSSTNHVLVLTDEGGRFSHAVAEAWVEGRHWVIDTNGLHDMAGWPSVSALFASIYPEARYVGEMRVAYEFGDPGKV